MRAFEIANRESSAKRLFYFETLVFSGIADDLFSNVCRDESRAEEERVVRSPRARTQCLIAGESSLITASRSLESISQWLGEALSQLLVVAPERVDFNVRFRELGLSSLQVTHLVLQLSEHIGRPLSATAPWEHPTPAALAQHIANGPSLALDFTHEFRGNASDPDRNQPIAIIGIACRLPGGVDSPEALWALLREGRHGIEEVPAERWDIDALFHENVSTPGKMNTRWGGFIRDVDQFDAAFFGISPREARQTDPQQRIMLELAWQALEDAGIDPSSLRDAAVGVYVGAMGSDYATLTSSHLGLIDQHTAPGVDTSIISARVSYQLGLRGPSVTVNTACSSSLVAIHLACQSLRMGESTMTLAGGAHLVLSPHGTVGMAKFGAMNPAGQCRSFDDSANGYVRGEGAGVVVLKPLARAIADGDRVYCVIRGSAANNDGFSNGLTAPNPRAQEAMLVQACAVAGVEPGSIEYVEAHGPGTILGDPIEAGALGAVFGPSHSEERPLRLGSIKTNVGHLEAAAGIAGLMKVALSLHYGALPASLNFERPNSHIPFEQLHLKVQTELEELQHGPQPVRAGVSSFGFGGTNCHVVLEAAPVCSTLLLPLAADTPEMLQERMRALSATASQLQGWSQEAGLCRAIAAERSGGAYRAAVLAYRSRGEPMGLGAALAAAEVPAASVGPRPRLVFVCSGHGSQWSGMGRSLLLHEPAFRAEIEACDRILKSLRGWSIADELVASENASRLNDTEVVQVVLFGVEVALGALWRSWGIVPDAILGHSFGEVAAAYLSGVLSREDAVLVIAERGRVTRELASGTGLMLAVTLPEDVPAGPLFDSLEGVTIAALNSPTSFVLSGSEAAIAAAEIELSLRGVKWDRVKIRYASHSPMMDPILAPFMVGTRAISPRRAAVPFRSTSRDAWLQGPECGPEHWASNLRNPVLFRQAVEAVACDGPTVFVELSPHPVLLRSIEHTIEATGASATLLPSCRRSEDERDNMLESLAALFRMGFEPNWEAALVRGPEREIWGHKRHEQREEVWAEQAEQSEERRRPDKGARSKNREDDKDHGIPIVLSAKSEAAVRAQAQRLREHLLAHDDLALVDVAYSLATTRAPFEHRAALVVHDRDELLTTLDSLAQGHPAPNTVLGRGGSHGKVVFVFPGQGSQWEGMALSLLDSSPVFRTQLEACERALAPHVDWSLLAVLRRDEGAASLDRIDVVQPALFAVMVSLAALWRSLGVEPSAVVGHSQGEIAAAFVAGALSLDDAAKVVARRSRLLSRLSGQGATIAVELSVIELAGRMERWGDRLSIAAINGPRSTVISGDTEAVDVLIHELESDQIFVRKVRTDVAAHNAQMDVFRDELQDLLSSLEPRTSPIPLYSTVSAHKLDGSELGTAYWFRNLREPVRFAETVQALLSDGYRFFVEVSPHPVFTLVLQGNFERSPLEPVVVGSIRRNEGQLARLLLSWAELSTRGLTLDWNAFFAPFAARKVPLPTYAFQRERFWLDASTAHAADVASAGLTSADHPLLGAAVSLADRDGFLFTGRLSLAEHPWLEGHAVFGTPILPGTGFLELALHVAHRVGLDAVEELALEAPLALPSQGAVVVQISVGPLDDAGRRSLSLHGRGEDAPQDGAWIRHASGSLAPATRSLSFDLHDWPPSGATPVETQGLYAALESAGLAYGPEFQGLRSVYKRGDELFAEAQLPDAAAKDAARFALHPALLDSALHALALEGEQATTVALPFSWSGVSLRSVGATALRVRFHRPKGETSVSLVVADAAGEPLASVQALAARLTTAEQLRIPGASHHDALFRIDWRELQSPTPPSRAPGGGVLGIGCPDLALQPREPPLARVADLAALRSALDQGASPPSLVVASLLDALAGDLIPSAHETTARALALLQAWIADERLASSRLVLLTRRAIATHPDEGVEDLAHAPLWGLVRSAQSEHPELPLVLVDLDDSEASQHALLGALDALDTKERQLALRHGKPLIPRLTNTRSNDALTPPNASAWRLHIPTKGTFDALALVLAPEAQAPLAHGQVRVAVHASGLNFRDVLDTLGTYPGDPGPLGNEGAGLVIEVGPGVSHYAVGDRVMGIFGAAFGPTAIADARMICPIPRAWSFFQAASVPIIYLTAYYGLVDLGHLKPNQRVLIHAAAGGVGTAAVQLARHLGAEVFATASTGKWSALRALGFDDAHLASSRDLGFEQHFLRSTNGRGMDVVLDCLAREFVDASLRLLPNGGRFIEMGKTDIREPEAIGLAHPGVVYRAFDLTKVGPDRIEQMLAELLRLFERGVLHLPPITPWDIRHAREAFRALAQARHVGKFVLTIPRPIDSEGTVLITGGTGTLGALVARHLVAKHSAKHLLLTSRQGASALGAEILRTELEALGASVTLAPCDAADPRALKALLDSIPSAHPLTAIVHAAGVLDDGLLGSMSPERIDRVFAPKVDAAWHLHTLTQDKPLAAFVLFSSAAGILGSAGQSNYAAANAFLDALAHHRRARGLPASSLAWGYWAERSGMTGHLSAADTARMKRAGVRPLTAAEGLALFDAALLRTEPALVPAPFDVNALSANAGAVPPLFQGLVRARTARKAASNTALASSLTERLSSLPTAERESVLLNLVRAEAATVLGLASFESLDPHRPLRELGLDSLMALELRNRLAAATELRLQPTLLFNHPTPAALATVLLGKLLQHEAKAPRHTIADLYRLETTLSEIHADETLREELMTRLQALLSKWTSPRSESSKLAQAKDLSSVTSNEFIELINQEFADLELPNE